MNEKIIDVLDGKNEEKKIIPVLKPGDICIFHGYLIHRSLPSACKNRKMLYIVCKKSWYNDEPEIAYNETLIY